MGNKRFNFTVVDSSDDEHDVIAYYSRIEGGYLCFYCGWTSLVLHAFYQPISSVCLGECIEEDESNG